MDTYRDYGEAFYAAVVGVGRYSELFRLYWVNDRGFGEVLDLGDVLGRYGSVFIGRLDYGDAYEARRRGVAVGSYDSVYVFKPGEYYRYMDVEDGFVSRRHVLLELREGVLYVVDHGVEGRGSRNGTFINGRRVRPREPYRVDHGDEVSLGSLTRLIVLRGDRPLSVDTPTVIGRGELEALRDAGVSVEYSEEAGKPVAYARQRVDTPISTPSGIALLASPDPTRTLYKIALLVLKAKNKILLREGDARSSVYSVVAHLRVAREDLREALKESGELLDQLEVAVGVLEGYARGYIQDDRVAVENLEVLSGILEAVIDVGSTGTYISPH